MSEVLSVSEASRELLVSAGTIREWADSGKLAVQRTGSGARIFTRAVIENAKAARSAALEARNIKAA